MICYFLELRPGPTSLSSLSQPRLNAYQSSSPFYQKKNKRTLTYAPHSQLFKSGDHSVDSANVTNVRHDAKISVLEKETPNTDRLVAHFFVSEKGEPFISTLLGPGVVYLTEG